MKKNKDVLSRNIIFNIIYEFLLIVTPILTVPYIARVLGSEGVGIYSYTNSLSSYFVMLAALGIYSYASREISINRNDKVKYSKIFWEIEILSIITSLVVMAVWIVLSFVYKEYSRFLLIFSLSIVAVIFDIAWLYAGLEKFYYIVSLNSIFKILGVISCFIFVKTDKDVGVYILIQVLTLLLSNLSMWIYLPKVLSKTSICLKNIFYHFKKSILFLLPNIAVTLYASIDKTMLGIFKGNVVTGYYEEASKLISIIRSVFIVGIINVISTRLSNFFSDKKEKEAESYIYFVLDALLFICIGSCFGLIGLSNKLIPIIFGEEFLPSIQILCFLSPIIIFLAINRCFDSLYFLPKGKIKQNALILGTGTVINFAINLILIPYISAIGACIASVVSECIIFLLYIKFSDRILTIKQILYVSWKKVFAGIIMFFALFFISQLTSNSFFGLLIDIVFGVFSYIIILLILKDSLFKNLIKILFKR